MRPEEGGLCTRLHTHTRGTHTPPRGPVFTHIHARTAPTNTDAHAHLAGGEPALEPDQWPRGTSCGSGGHGASGDSRAGLRGQERRPRANLRTVAQSPLGVSTVFASPRPGPAAEGEGGGDPRSTWARPGTPQGPPGALPTDN